MRDGLFIVVESQDGGGKGTQTPRIVQYLRETHGESAVVQTKEPGGTELGDLVREILFTKVGTKNLGEGVMDCLFLASHLQNWHTVVKPALDAGKIVVSDRWAYSQLAYATQRKVQKQIAVAYEECRGRNADLLLFMHGDTDVLTARANSRTNEDHQSTKSWNDPKTLAKIQQAYVELFAGLPEYRAICVDGKLPDDVWLEVRDQVDAAVARWTMELVGMDH